MEVIYLERGKGKTTELIKMCYEENKKPNNLTYILCFSKDNAINTFKLSKDLKIDIPFPLTWNEFKHMKIGYSGYIENLIIDDAEFILEEAIGYNFNILGLSLTKSSEEE